MTPIPKKAATVIILREKRPDGFEVFLLRRHEKSSFMGGNYVYPGGRVDRGDGTLKIDPLCRGITPEETHQIFGEPIPPEESFAHWIAGIRELFEESGVLLAYDQKGNLFHPKDNMERRRFSNYRALIQKRELTLYQLAQDERLLLALDQLHYYAHWITPGARSIRFDTRFFLARHPRGQEASHDRMETIAGLWLTPQQALAENLEGEVVLSPPTLKTLEDLSRFKSIGDLLDSLKKASIRPILPILTKIADEPFILFPWDPEYAVFQGGEIPNLIDHGRPSRTGDNTTRVVLKKDHWIPYCRKDY